MDTIIFKIDKKLKTKAQKMAKEGGFSMSDYYRHVTHSLAEGEATLGVINRPKLNKKTVRELIKISKDIKAGRNLSPAFKTIKEMKEYLSK